MAKEKGMENILISPVVVASSLGMVALGGKASTASQVKTVLSADKLKDEHLHAGLSELLTEVSTAISNTQTRPSVPSTIRSFVTLSQVSDAKKRNTTWKINNRLYGPSSVSFADEFVKTSKKHYNYDHSKINFRDKRSAVNSINEWAAKSTDGKLPEITKDVQNTDGAMIVNAMFFKRKYEWSLLFKALLCFHFLIPVTRRCIITVQICNRALNGFAPTAHWHEKFHDKMVDQRGFLVTRSFTIGIPMMHRTGEFLLRHYCVFKTDSSYKNASKITFSDLCAPRRSVRLPR